MAGFGLGLWRSSHRRRRGSGGGTPPVQSPLSLPAAQWGVPYSASGSAAGWPNGSYPLGMGITVIVTGGTFTASGTPA